MKRIVSIQDISCIGKCSLSVALPIISAAGTECAIIPTAVLSTQSMFEGFTFKDLTDQIIPITNHWKQQNLKFDGIYTGYLGSPEQIKLIGGLFNEIGSSALKFVDPVMGDSGEFYPGFRCEFAKQIKSLCSEADVITPNLTEAYFLLGMPYSKEYDENKIKNMLKELCKINCKSAIITGISFSENEIGIMGYSRSEDKFFSHFTEKIPGFFHGTGDIFSSCCVGALIKGKSLEESASIAADFIRESILKTIQSDNPKWYGIDFESAIPYYIDRLK